MEGEIRVKVHFTHKIIAAWYTEPRGLNLLVYLEEGLTNERTK